MGSVNPDETFLAAIVDNQLRERTLWYNTTNGPQEYVVSAVKDWLASAEEKTETILITKHRKKNFALIRIEGHVIRNVKLSFKKHVDFLCKNASTASMALARMVPNIGGPWHTCRLLVVRMVSCILMNVCSGLRPPQMLIDNLVRRDDEHIKQ